MSAPRCARTWEAEALEDGRLVGSDRAAFDRHAATCGACQRELLGLARLREALKHLPAPDVAPLERQRLRAKLLRRANEHVVAPRPTHGARWALVVALAAIVVAAAWLGRPSSAPSRASAPEEERLAVTSAAAPQFDVESVDDGRWEARVDGGDARVALTGGVASFAVRTLEASQRFIVVVPDGEIEVRGTRFTVRVDEGHTRGVDVSEGRVVLRLHGQPEVALSAGERWPRAEPSALPPPVVPTTAARAPEAARAVAPKPPASLATPGAAMPPSTTSAAPAIADAGERFDEAMGSFKVGAYARAESQLARFLREFPRDPRGEDAAFLRAVARSRLGDAAGAAALARGYLRAFPNGLRRVEAQRLADASP